MEIIAKSEVYGDRTYFVDDEDFEILNKYCWYINSGGYANTKIDGKPTLMHRFIMSLYEDISIKHIDHINSDPTCNYKSNLRTCTNAENSRNKRIRTNRTMNSTSIYKGVYWDKNCNKWVARIVYNYKTIHLGVFDDERLAAKAYDQAASYFFKEFAKFNFPDESIDDIINIEEMKNKYDTNFKNDRCATPYYGIYLHKSGRWHASIKINGRKISLKYHETDKEGAYTVDKYIIENKLTDYYHKLNFPEKYKDIIKDD